MIVCAGHGEKNQDSGARVFLFLLFFFCPWHAVNLPVDVLLGKNQAKGTQVGPNNCNQNYQPNKQIVENR